MTTWNIIRFINGIHRIERYIFYLWYKKEIENFSQKIFLKASPIYRKNPASRNTSLTSNIAPNRGDLLGIKKKIEPTCSDLECRYFVEGFRNWTGSEHFRGLRKAFFVGRQNFQYFLSRFESFIGNL